MRANPVRAKLRKGGTVFGHMAFEFFTPGLCQTVANAGGRVRACSTPSTPASASRRSRAQVAYARGMGLVPLVRVPACHDHLDRPGARCRRMGIMVPMMETAEQAADLARGAAIDREGVRGLAFGMPHDDYKGGDHIKAMKARERAHAGDRADRDCGRNRERRGDHGDARHRYRLDRALRPHHASASTENFDHPRYKAAVKALVKRRASATARRLASCAAT